MALRDQPYLPLYVDNFVSDEKLRLCSALSTGVFIRIMCLMHKSDYYGKIKLQKNLLTLLVNQNVDQNLTTWSNFAKVFARQLAKQFPYDIEEIETGLRELIENKVIYIDGEFLCQKRMVKDGEVSLKRVSAGNQGVENRKKNKLEKIQPITFGIPNDEPNGIPNDEPNSVIEIKDKYRVDIKGGIGNEEGVQGGEKSGGEEEEIEIEIPTTYVEEIKLNKEDLQLLSKSSDEFKMAWQKWLNYYFQQHDKKYKSFIMKQQALTELVTLAGMDENYSIAIINHCIAGGYMRFYKPGVEVKLSKEEIAKTIKYKKNLLQELLRPHIAKYGRDMVNLFYRYWGEADLKTGKLKWEVEETWEIEGRLRNWYEKNLKIKKYE